MDYEGYADKLNRRIDKLIEVITEDPRSRVCPDEIGLSFECIGSCRECWLKAIEEIE
jgi:hypothetical protein